MLKCDVIRVTDFPLNSSQSLSGDQKLGGLTCSLNLSPSARYCCLRFERLACSRAGAKGRIRITQLDLRSCLFLESQQLGDCVCSEFCRTESSRLRMADVLNPIFLAQPKLRIRHGFSRDFHRRSFYGTQRFFLSAHKITPNPRPECVLHHNPTGPLHYLRCTPL